MLRSAREGWVRSALALLVFVVALIWSSPASAYPWMIRHGYAGCNSCHADPSGGSLLTQYGRAQGELLLRTRYPGDPEEPGDMAKFLFGAIDLPESVLLGGDFRAAEFSESTASAPRISQWIWMQADVDGQVSITDRLRVNGSIGYVPQGDLPASLTSSPNNNVVSRVHWIGWDLGSDKNFTARAGRMNLPFGIRSIEHTYLVRTATSTDVDDTQQYGAALAYNGEFLRGEGMLIAGNFEESPDKYRARGYSAYVDWAPVERLSLGLSSLVTHADTDVQINRDAWRQAHGVMGRWSPWLPVVFSTEWDAVVLGEGATAKAAAKTTLGPAGFLQADVEVVQGLHLSTTGELLNTTPGTQSSTYEWWGTVWWFLGPHVDFRADVVILKAPDAPSSTSLLGMVHAFL